MFAGALRSIASVDLGPIQKLVATVGLCLAPNLASIVQANPQFDAWTTENGLPQNSINDILQTRDGYLWLATYGGLVRFDGVRFVVFDRSVEGIGSVRVKALHEDRHGILWAATEDGMLIRYRDGRFLTYNGKNGLPDAQAIRIEEDDEGALWITWIGTITKYDGEHFQNFGPDHFGNLVTAPPVTLNRYTNAWWGVDAAGFHALVGGRVRTYPIDANLNGGGVARVLPDRCGNLWITTTNAALLKATPERVQQFTSGEGLNVSQRDGTFLGDCNDNVWFQDVQLNVYRVRNGQAERIGIPPILAIYGDREGSLWVGTSWGGLRRLRDTSISSLDKRDGLPLDIVYSIFEDRAGAFWIGTWGVGLSRYAAGRYTLFGLSDGLPSLQISCIYEDRDGRLWVGTDQGLSYFAGGRFRRYVNDAGLLRQSVWAMHEDRSGTFWFATDAGLVRSSRGTVTRFTRTDGLTHDRTSALFEDRSGTLWIGTYQGLTRLKAGVFTGYGEPAGLIGSSVRAIYEDSHAILWIGTYDGGLYRLSGERLTRYTRSEGLYDNGVFQILEDDNENLWMGSNRGISRISRHELNELAEGRRRLVKPVVFGARDGLASVEVNGGRQPAGIRARDGRLWFPTMAGVAIIDPRALRTGAKPPPAIIEEFRMTGRAVDFTQPVQIPPDAATFEIRYTAPSFINPEQIRFRYRLRELDGEWIEAGDRRSASFFRIPSGHYRFEVIAATHDGQWGTSAASVEIDVLAPFWRTSWFMMLALAACGSLAFTGHLVRTRRLRKLHELRETFSRQLIHSQEGERQRISTELHDSIGQDLGIIRKVARARQENGADPESVKESLREIGAVAERADAQMKEIAYGLRPHQLDTIGLSKTIDSMVRRVGKACEVEFTSDIECVDDLFPPGSHIHIFRIVQEAISNIVRHSKASHAKAIVARVHGSVEIRIEDNGVGFSADRFTMAGIVPDHFGLVSMRERARILGGRVEFVSSPGTGTAVVVTLPLEAATVG
jgi:signal transduction histidine kinase/ligand-binding sensor domain-containing protein